MLTPEELSGLEATLLPALERHHLRLLAHGLRTLQQIAGRRSGDPPSAAAVRRWVLQQPATADDDGFAEAFSAQMLGVAEQLSAIAGPSRPALDLDLGDLERWARRQADARIAAAHTADAHTGAAHSLDARSADARGPDAAGASGADAADGSRC